MSQPKVLIVEDERALVQALTWHLTREGYEVIAASDGQDGLRKAQTLLPDVVLLDIMLPVMDGLAVLRELRAGDRTRDIPVVLITAKSEEADQVLGFGMGADDYVPKPFANKVLVAKVKALLRRSQGQPEAGDVVEHQGVRIDRVRHKASVNGQTVELTPTEFRLLECLLRQPGRAFSRHQLMDAAIGEGQIVLERTIDVHVKTLRKKMGAAAGELIETVRGVGYRFQEALAEAGV